MWITLATQAFSLVEGYFSTKKEKQQAQAKMEVALKEAEAEVFKRKSLQDGEWDLESMRGSKDSWKDEFFVIILSLPFIASFIPQLQEYVAAGFLILDRDTPEWYKAAFGVAIAASFGFRQFAKFKKK